MYFCFKSKIFENLSIIRNLFKLGKKFGMAPRFPKEPLEMHREAVKKRNDANVDGLAVLDPKADPIPGPGYYKVTETWRGKQVKGSNKPRGRKKGKRRPYSANPGVGDKILRTISKGPTLSIYHKKF